MKDPEKGVTVVEFPKPGISSAPNAWNFSRFIHLVEEVEGETGHVSGMMDTLREQLQNLLPDFGEHMGYDGKAIDSHSTGQVNRETGETSDPDADWGKQETHSVDAQGKRRTRTRTWFGYRLHLIADTVHELPIAFEVTRASTSESVILPKMINELFSEDSNLKQRCKDFSADRGLDSGSLKKMMWEDHQVRPLIDVRQLWREEKAEPGYDSRKSGASCMRSPGTISSISEQGNVYCRCPETGEERPMTFQGFEADRNTLKYRCPAAAAGVTCQGREACYQQADCQAGDYGRIVRVDLNTADPRIFTPTPHGSPTWKRGYKRRNALERINSRLDNRFGFELHYLRGQTRMQTRVGLALTIMMALAVGHIRAGRPEQMRSLVGAIPFADTS